LKGKTAFPTIFPHYCHPPAHADRLLKNVTANHRPAAAELVNVFFSLSPKNISVSLLSLLETTMTVKRPNQAP
jgi:hypothetical protein